MLLRSDDINEDSKCNSVNSLSFKNFSSVDQNCLCFIVGAVSYDTYRKMDANDLFKFVKTMARKHPRHRSRYSHTAWLHSATPDPIQNKIIDRCVI